MTRLIAWALFLGLGLGSSACTAIAAEEKDEKEMEMKFADAPAAVQKTMTAEAGGAKIDMVEKEMEDGKTVYEAEAMINGKRYELEVAEDGTLLCKKLEAADDEEDKNGKDDDDDDEKEDDDKAEKK